MKNKLYKLLTAAIVLILLLSALPLSAAPAADIPAKMLDNVFLDALTYTGYKTGAQKADGSIFKTYGSKTPSSVLSGIGYGTGPSGLETVAANTKTGKAPDGYILSDETHTVTLKENGQTVRLNIKNSKIPEKPTEPQSPKTGDATDLYIPFAVLLLSVAFIIVLKNMLKKESFKNDEL